LSQWFTDGSEHDENIEGAARLTPSVDS